MTISTQTHSAYKTSTTITVHIGDHTYGQHTFHEYAPNAIRELYDACKALAKEIKKTNPELVVSRGFTKDDIHRLNFLLETEYKREMEEYTNIVANLPFLQEEQVTLSQLNAFSAISNHYGRHASKTYLKYQELHNAVSKLEQTKKALENDGHSLSQIYI